MFYLAARDLLYADLSDRIVYTRPLLHHGRVLDLSFVGGQIELFHIPANAEVCAILVFGMVHIKDSLLLVKKGTSYRGGSRFFSHYLSDPLPYNCK